MMTEPEKLQLVRLLNKRREELRRELEKNDYSELESVRYSKYNQIEWIDNLLIQLPRFDEMPDLDDMEGGYEQFNLPGAW